MNSSHKPNWHSKTHARVITTVVVTALRLAGEHCVGATVLACFFGDGPYAANFCLASRLFPWVKRWFDGAYLRKYRSLST